MTREPDLPPLDPAEEVRVRRLLADARVTQPAPPEVVDRLDRALADLVAERATDAAHDDVAAASAVADRPSTVVPITSRSRRAKAGALLAGAAAVVVMGIGIGQFVGTDGGDAGGGTADEAAVDRGSGNALDAGAAKEEPTAARAEAEGVPAEAATQEPEAFLSETMSTDEPPRTVRPRRLLADLTALQDATLPNPATADYSASSVTAPEGFACADAPWGRGVIVAVLYDRMPAMVAFREPMGDSQVAEVLQCGTGDVLRSTTLPTGR